MSDSTSRLPRSLYSAAQVRELDRIAIEEFDVPGFQLMQRAAAMAFSHLLETWPQVKKVQVFVGKGKNGGDGYILAGMAVEHGLKVELVAVSSADTLEGDARAASDWAHEHGARRQTFAEFQASAEPDSAQTVIVDALLGTGLDRPVEGIFRDAISAINTLPAPVLAIDIPSGLSADTGAELGLAVKASETVSFIGLKQGLLTNLGRDCCGSILYSDLDVPERVFSSTDSPVPSARRIDINSVSHLFVPRLASSHKGSHGHVVIVGGDERYGGAALMAAEAAQRVGAGLVSLITRSAHRAAILSRRPELMVLGTEDSDSSSASVNELLLGADVIVIGPGLGRNDWSQQLLQAALAAQTANDIPLIVDADGLNLLAQRFETGARLKRDNWILTPHPGEAANLLASKTADIQQDRFAAIKKLQNTWGGHCLLKGSGSLICVESESQQEVFLSTEGNAGMASAGMGDVLSGIIGGLSAQGMSLTESLCAGVCIHGEAGDLAAAAGGQRGLAATDLFPYIRQLVNASSN